MDEIEDGNERDSRLDPCDAPITEGEWDVTGGRCEVPREVHGMLAFGHPFIPSRDACSDGTFDEWLDRYLGGERHWHGEFTTRDLRAAFFAGKRSVQ